MDAKMPELGDLVVGDEVIVCVDPSSRNKQYVPALIVKTAKVWIDVEPVDGEPLPYYALRFRRDNQTAKAKPEHWTPYFRTVEQVEWEGRLASAHAYLREVGVRADSGSRFVDDALALANAIRRGLGEDEL